MVTLGIWVTGSGNSVRRHHSCSSPRTSPFHRTTLTSPPESLACDKREGLPEPPDAASGTERWLGGRDWGWDSRLCKELKPTLEHSFWLVLVFYRRTNLNMGKIMKIAGNLMQSTINFFSCFKSTKRKWIKLMKMIDPWVAPSRVGARYTQTIVRSE